MLNKILYYTGFTFFRFRYNTYHYTDNRQGSPTNYLAYLIQGQCEIISEDKNLKLKAGDLFFIPKGLRYQSVWKGENGIDFLSFGFSELHIKVPFDFDLQILPCNAEIVQKLMRIPTNGKDIDCKTLSLFYDAMSDILPHMQSVTPKDGALVERIKQCIRQHPYVSMQELAVLCAISAPYLYAVFRKNVGITPNEYRQKVLCKMGISLLLTTDKKVEEIAEILHFSSASYFRKILKKHTGSTPKQIRKKRKSA